jgi:hypothetical protein
VPFRVKCPLRIDENRVRFSRIVRKEPHLLTTLVIDIGGNLRRQTREAPYLKEVKWVVCESHGGKDETTEFRIFALELFNLP